MRIAVMGNGISLTRYYYNLDPYCFKSEFVARVHSTQIIRPARSRDYVSPETVERASL